MRKKSKISRRGSTSPSHKRGSTISFHAISLWRRLHSVTGVVLSVQGQKGAATWTFKCSRRLLTKLLDLAPDPSRYTFLENRSSIPISVSGGGGSKKGDTVFYSPQTAICSFDGKKWSTMWTEYSGLPTTQIFQKKPIPNSPSDSSKESTPRRRSKNGKGSQKKKSAE